MVTVLADTSAWLEFEHASGSPAHLRIKHLLRQESLAWTEPVLMELLAGTKHEKDVIGTRTLLGTSRLLSVLPSVDFEQASEIYRACRRAGVAPRGLTDCLIAAVAQRHEVPVLAHDADLARIADVIGLALDPGSLRP